MRVEPPSQYGPVGGESRDDRVPADSVQPWAIQPRHLSVTMSLSYATLFNSLPIAFARRGILRRVLRFSSDLEIFEPGDAANLELVGKLRGFRFANSVQAQFKRIPVLRRWPALPLFPARLADHWVARQMRSQWLPPSRIFHGLHSTCLATMRTARQLGVRTVLDYSSLHPQVFQQEVLSECAALGTPPRRCSRLLGNALIRRIQSEFESCDKIAVLSTSAQRSFQAFPYGHKTVVILPGTDHRFFTPRESPHPGDVFRVCYVGRVEAAKGVAYLIDAWNRLGLKNAELVLVGQVYPEIAALLSATPSASIRCLGHKSLEDISQCLRASDLFAFPSVNEGFGVAVLEAMASGLPAIACQGAGPADCIVHGRDGFLLPGKSSEALAECILWCSRHRDAAAAMGRAARKTVEGNFTLAHYEARLIAMYEALLGGP